MDDVYNNVNYNSDRNRNILIVFDGYFYKLDSGFRTWIRTLDPGPRPWTLPLDLEPKNLDPGKPGINIGLRNMSDFR